MIDSWQESDWLSFLGGRIHDRKCDRRDIWVELSFWPETDYGQALVGMARAKAPTKSGVARFSECTARCAQKVVTLPDIVRDAMFANNPRYRLEKFRRGHASPPARRLQS